MSKICSIETLKSIYFAHIYSHLSFYIVIYGANSDENMDSLLTLQKSALNQLAVFFGGRHDKYFCALDIGNSHYH